LIEQCLTSTTSMYRLSGRQFYRSKDPTNSIKVLKEKHCKGKTRKSKQHKIQQHNKETHIQKHSKSSACVSVCMNSALRNHWTTHYWRGR